VEVSQAVQVVVHITDQALHKVETFLSQLILLLVLAVVQDFKMTVQPIMVAQLVVQVLQYFQ
jgi:hypothetical protein